MNGCKNSTNCLEISLNNKIKKNDAGLNGKNDSTPVRVCSVQMSSTAGSYRNVR